MLPGIMMHRPLRVSDILDFAAEIHPTGEVVSVMLDGSVHRISYQALHRRVARLAHALREMGVGPGDRVATLAWNTHRHFELYYAISGLGAVCHTINPRLSAEQFTYIVNHAGDRALFFDVTFAAQLAALRGSFPDEIEYVALCESGAVPEEMPDARAYDDLLEGQPDSITLPDLDENDACALCYTSGTTGNPKGVLYSNRSMVLHALMMANAEQNIFREGRRILPVVPLFHANAWGLPYTAPLAGASLVMPGMTLDGPSIFRLADREEVYSAFGVPTVWMSLLDEMDRQGRKPKGLGEVVTGGSAAPRRLVERFMVDYGVEVIHGWGMTETSPIGTLSCLPVHLRGRPVEERIDRTLLQGRRAFGFEMKIVDEDGNDLPWDGVSVGEYLVRGNGVVRGYYNNEAATKAAITPDGWFRTGDMASITPEGEMKIADRSKDLIKSGGEWISSIDVENMAMSHPAVANCAVIAVPHPKWVERPLLVVQRTPGTEAGAADLRAHVAANLAKWQVPDDVVFVDELPMTATGKVSKRTLRERYKDHPMDGAPG
ncbi:MAG: long-chain fatty acid--CoA ligase [Pseudomonadota bacterium]